MKKVLVVENLNFLSLFVIIYFKLCKSEVFLYQYSGSPFKYWLIRVLSIQACDFEGCIDIDSGPIFGHEGDSMDQITDEFIDKEILRNFSQFFIGIKDLDGKIRLLIKQYVFSRCNKLNSISVWINGYFPTKTEQPYKIYLMGGICRIGESFLLKECHDLKVTPVFASNSHIIFNLISRVSRKLLRVISVYLKKYIAVQGDEADDSLISSVMSSNMNNYSYKVLFFPHKSIFYSNLFMKDVFYSNDMNSAYHPSNILHVEFENLELSSKQYEFYTKNCITTVLFPSLKIAELYGNFKYIISTLGLVNTFFFLKKDLFFFCTVLFLSIKFLSTRQAIKIFSDVEVVLIGYEINFPPIISIAFESINAKTVAVQERFMPTAFYSNFGFIVDSYFCSSTFVSSQIRKSKNKFSNVCIPCGQIRTDKLLDFQKANTQVNDKFTIVVFDYHSELNINLNRHKPITNWRANNHFYNDLCQLAEQLPNINIIIRGKDINWTKNEFFKDVLIRINNNFNIVVDDVYSELMYQYKLAAKADLIIAKHTSIGDELISTGKKVIFYDFLPNSKKVISREYDYNKSNIFVYSYNELELTVKSAIDGNYPLTESKLIELQHILNNGMADGKVKDRVMSRICGFIKAKS